MPGTRVQVDQQERFWEAIRNGASQRTAARVAGISESTAKRLLKKPSNGREYREVRRQRDIPESPLSPEEWSEEARRATEDFPFFCRRYFGVELSPWQVEASRRLIGLAESPDREFVVLNAPPGLGKSTLLVMLAGWWVVRDRTERILFISRAHSLAERNAMRLRRALERSSPAVGADACLAVDFGRFKPRMGEMWKRDEYVVEQMDGSPIEEKEPTVSSFGFDSEWIGNRLTKILGDDLDSTKTIRSMEIVEKNRDIFDNELEPRVEPRGLMAICQQRLGSFDFSDHCLSKVVLPDDDGSDEDPDGTSQYGHIIYKAHYEDRCEGRASHRADSPPYPDGCLLDPRRLPWRDVRKVMNNPSRFKVVYQQEDAAASDALVQRIWVDGGYSPSGEKHIGCWDPDRGVWELPVRHDGTSALDGPVIGVVTVDPSPTRFWSIQAWVYHPASEQRFLLDLHRERMEAPEFLDWSQSLGSFTGIVEDWWQAFRRLGVPLSYVIVERNAAQRFMLQYDHFHRWMRTRQVSVLAHETTNNKAHPDYGVQMLGPKWRHGQVRLPGKLGMSRIASMRLVDEVLRWPHSATTDCVMGQWFLEHAIATYAIGVQEEDASTEAWTPAWLRGAA